MILGSDPGSPPFVYHAARKLSLKAAERFIAEAAEESRKKALATLKSTIADLESREYEVACAGIIIANRPLDAALDKILANHTLIHTAEGELYRGAIKRACESLKIPVVEIRSAELQARAPLTVEKLSRIGKTAGPPWSRDQKDSLLAALLALVE